MHKCYESLDDAFVDQLQKIKCLHADAVFQQYRAKRYGLNCPVSRYQVGELEALRALMEYNESLDLSQFDANTFRNALDYSGLLANECIADYRTESLRVCNISFLVEKINVL